MTNPTKTKDFNLLKLLSWYISIFVPQLDRGYAVMNPSEADSKYIRHHNPLTTELIAQSFQGGNRRLPINGSYVSFPLSIAVTPQHTNGTATHFAIDVDHGGLPMMKKVLHYIESIGLWGFAQLGKSTDQHSGGHIYVPVLQPMTADLLHDLAKLICDHLEIKGETYPTNRDLRLPLMPHLRAPGGSTRFPLLLPGGKMINADDPIRALAALQEVLVRNTHEQIMEAHQKLQPEKPKPEPTKKSPLHKSKARPHNVGSVIRWFNDNHSLESMLRDAGMKDPRHCPFHEDKNPSLSIWEHTKTGHHVCSCKSRDSNCPASKEHYWDAFNIYCYTNKLTQKEAVKQLVKENNLGQKQIMQTTSIQSPKQSPLESQTKNHDRFVKSKREELKEKLEEAAKHPRRVSVFKGVPGIGKTTAGTNLANMLHMSGKTVAIVASDHRIAQEEWAPVLSDAFVWKPKTKLCTCYDQEYLKLLSLLGYTLPKCKEECAYQEQYEQRKGKITIYQHNHLHLNNGELLIHSDVIIIDESIFDSLLEERHATQTAIVTLLNKARNITPIDPALLLIQAFDHASQAARKKGKMLLGQEVISLLAETMGGIDKLQDAVKQAKSSSLANPRPLGPKEIPENLMPQFFGKMLEALEHDLENPKKNGLLSWAQVQGKWCWSWYKRHTLLGKLEGRLDSPAVLLLDGSANEAVYKKFLSPWEVKQIEIDIPLSPMTTIIQAPTLPSTRRIVHDNNLQERTTRHIAHICNELNLTLDGGITYQDFVPKCKEVFEGKWLYYGNQRGTNALADSSTIALVASPTAPPNAILRKASALYSNEELLDSTWKKVATGYYKAKDPRLEAVNRLHGIEELNQSLHRSRPILATEPTTILVCSPWPLSELNIVPDITVTQTAHGNSSELKQAIEKYKKRKAERGGGKLSLCNKTVDFKTGVKNTHVISSVLKSPPKLQSPPPLSTSCEVHKEARNRGAP